MGFLPIFLYVAVVSDNDGSAFITKAEFDSLKNNFQAQIDNYNQSIDSKIDGAIASYLAGIKVDTDGRPEYRIYGKPYGSAPYIYNGKVSNAICLAYMGPVGTHKVGTSTSWAGDGCFEVVSKSKTNRGYGFAWWVKGKWWDNTWTPVRDDLCLYLGPYVDGDSDGLFVVTSHVHTGATLLNLDSKNKWENVCDLLMSDAFNTCISVYDPEFPLIDFLDNGEAIVSLAYVKNGYQYEGETKGGRNGAVGQFAGQEAQIQLKRSGSVVNHFYVNSKSETNWNEITFDVKSGDRLVLKCTHKGSNTAEYGLFWFATFIPGWKIAD